MNLVRSTGPNSPLPSMISPEVRSHRIGLAEVPLADPDQFGHHRIGLVPLVPDEGQPSVRSQDADDLGERPRRVEPVERLGDDHGVHRAVATGMHLGGPTDHRYPGDHPAEDLAHGQPRARRPRSGAVGPQLAGELARAGGEVEDLGPAGEARHGLEVGDGVLRIPRSGPLVDVGPGRESGPTERSRSSAVGSHRTWCHSMRPARGDADRSVGSGRERPGRSGDGDQIASE